MHAYSLMASCFVHASLEMEQHEVPKSLDSSMHAWLVELYHTTCMAFYSRLARYGSNLLGLAGQVGQQRALVAAVVVVDVDDDDDDGCRCVICAV